MGANATNAATPAKTDPTQGHTPTPWDDDGICVYDGVGATIARVEPAGNATSQAADAALIVRAVNNHQALIDELTKAHRIIFNALNLMTPEQKHVWGGKNAADECDGEGTTRRHEREAVIDAANGEA